MRVRIKVRVAEVVFWRCVRRRERPRGMTKTMRERRASRERDQLKERALRRGAARCGEGERAVSSARAVSGERQGD